MIKLGLKGVIEEIKSITDILFKPLSLEDHRELKIINILSNINPVDFLALLDLFIPLEIYVIIAENTNLYVITKNTPTTRNSTNTRYWWSINKNKIRVLFNILFYMGVYKEPNYKVY